MNRTNNTGFSQPHYSMSYFLMAAQQVILFCVYYSGGLGQHQWGMVCMSPDNNFHHTDVKVEFTSSGIHSQASQNVNPQNILLLGGYVHLLCLRMQSADTQCHRDVLHMNDSTPMAFVVAVALGKLVQIPIKQGAVSTHVHEG
uniref:Uncharacterized protein n=1 Tax=Rousettus aegyptiacus TaxID=9407 RepID=A0A7J8BDS3_ROUAE|nr:hypothetical protein HJG63_009675 [Rousettus aegyptiacus]